MKKISLIFALCILVTSLNAQRLGAKLGLNLATDKYIFTGTDITTTSLAGLQTGVIFEMPLDQSWYFNSGLLYSMKGAKVSFMSVEGDLHINYIDIPLNICYKYDIQTLKIFFQAGPYTGIGLTSKLKSGGIDKERDFGSGNAEMKRLDLGLNFGAGVEIQKMQLSINYGLGLRNLSNYSEETLKNRVLSFSVAYFLK